MNAALVMLTIVSTLVAAAASLFAWRLEREHSQRAEARVAALAEDIHGPGFVPDFQRSTDAGAIVLVAILAAFTIVAALWVGRSTDSGRAAATPAAASPLELVALSHTITADGLLVTGRVRNPAGAARRKDLSVLVLAYDDLGQVIARAQGDAASSLLEPGQSSTFALTVPGRTAPARFKVSFRQGEDAISHVDRRTDAGAAPERGQP